MDVRVLGRADVHGGLYGGCYGHLDGCVYCHLYGRQYGLNMQNLTGILSGYRGWKKSCTTRVHGLKLLHGTVRPIDGPPLPPNINVEGLIGWWVAAQMSS